MATGSFTVSITVPVTNANDPNNTGRIIVETLLDQAKAALGGLTATSGNLIYPPGSGTVAGTWTFTVGT